MQVAEPLRAPPYAGYEFRRIAKGSVNTARKQRLVAIRHSFSDRDVGPARQPPERSTGSMAFGKRLNFLWEPHLTRARCCRFRLVRF